MHDLPTTNPCYPRLWSSWFLRRSEQRNCKKLIAVLFGFRWHGMATALLILFAALWSRPAGAEPAIITSARQVHQLPADEALESIPVHLIATVTYFQPKENVLFVADASGAVFVTGNFNYPLHPGDLVEVNGLTERSLRTVVRVQSQIRVLSSGHPVFAEPVDYRQLMSGKVDCRSISIHGTVRSASLEMYGDDKVAQLQIMMRGGIVQAYILDYQGLDLFGLIDAEVQLSGTAGAVFNARLQTMRPKLFTSSAKELRILQKPKIKPLDLPITDIGNVVETHFVLDQSKRVRVQGAVTAYDPGYSMVIQHDGQSLLVLTRQAEPLPLGSVVEVIGFADDHAYSAVLEDAQVFATGRTEQVTPQAVNYVQGLSGIYSDTLVTLRGRVLSELHDELSDTMVVMVDGHPVNMVMRRNGGSPLPELPQGTLVAASGICRVTPGITWNKPLLFRLDLRQSSDLKVTARPSWWDVKHLLLVIGTLLTLSSLIMAWVLVLRRRVANQTEQIEHSIKVERQRSRLLEEINSETPLEQLLEDICLSMGDLVPQVRCSCTLTEDATVDEGGRRTAEKSVRMEFIYEAALTDARGHQIGIFRVESTVPRTLGSDEKETLGVGASLANLAVNQRRMYQELNYRSTHDQLTALPNRRLAETRLDAAVRKATQCGTRVGVVYIDVDHFKQVNDQHGHKIGDLYLQQIAKRLGSKVRAVDLLARIGGDEFLLVATALHSLEDSETYKRRLQGCFDESFLLEGICIRGSVSIGLAVFPDHGTTPEDLKRHADMEMYAAKHRNHLHGEQPRQAAESTEIFSPADLRAALEADQFKLFYQPQFSAQGQLRGLEALIRLEDPILGIVAPDAFIGLAERSDIIFPLGAWVLRQALADAAHWGVGTDEDVRIIVNVSAREVEQPGFAESVALALAKAGVPPRCLELEITERTVICNPHHAILQLTNLRALGVSVSLDDFGTGHSSLNILHKLPVDTLKIDRSFVRAMGAEPGVLRVIEAIVHLGRAMGKRVVAEGVESSHEIDTLLQLGDMDFQGYAFSRPLPPESIEHCLHGWRKGVATRQ